VWIEVSTTAEGRHGPVGAALRRGARHVTTLSVRMVTYAENGTSSVQMAKGSLRGEVLGGAEKAHGELVAAGRSSGFSLSVIRGNWRLHDRTEEMRDSTGARWTINTRVSKDGRQVHTDVLREGVVTRTFDDVYSAAVNGVLLLSRQTLHANGKASILVEAVVNDMREDSEFSPALYRAIARSGRSEHGVLRSSAVASTPSPFVASDDGGGSTWRFYLATGFAAMSSADLLGVREGMTLYVLGFGGLVALVIGASKLFDYRSSLRDR
jgi:hypothetical protein